MVDRRRHGLRHAAMPRKRLLTHRTLPAISRKHHAATDPFPALLCGTPPHRIGVCARRTPFRIVRRFGSASCRCPSCSPPSPRLRVRLHRMARRTERLQVRLVVLQIRPHLERDDMVHGLRIAGPAISLAPPTHGIRPPIRFGELTPLPIVSPHRSRRTFVAASLRRVRRSVGLRGDGYDCLLCLSDDKNASVAGISAAVPSGVAPLPNRMVTTTLMPSSPISSILVVNFVT